MESHAAAAKSAGISQNQQTVFSGQDASKLRQWTLLELVAFRAVFSYFTLYSFPCPLNLIPRLGAAFAWYEALLSKMTLWAGAHIFHLQQPPSPGQSDSLYGWILNLVIVVLAAFVVILWSVLDRQRRDYSSMQQWLWLYVRLTLGSILIFYGAAKVIKTQFPDLTLWRLIEPYGDGSPMGLLWTFMGYSKTYNLFTGLVEFTAGALLFIPRLSTLGSLLSVGALANVLLLNLSYDVPVKLYSFNLLLMGLFLMSRDFSRLLDVFLLNRQSEPLKSVPFFRRQWQNNCLFAGQVLLLFYFGCTELYSSHKVYKEMGDGSPKPSLYGVYSVDEFLEDGLARLPLFTDATRWHRITFDRHNPWSCFFDGQVMPTRGEGTCVTLFPVDGPIQRFNGDLDEARKTLDLTGIGGQDVRVHFSIDRPAQGVIVLSGIVDGKNIRTRLRSLDITRFPINQRGFHWINEVPFNR